MKSATTREEKQEQKGACCVIRLHASKAQRPSLCSGRFYSGATEGGEQVYLLLVDIDNYPNLTYSSTKGPSGYMS